MATSSLPSTVAFDWRPPPTRVRLCRWLLTKLGQRLVSVDPSLDDDADDFLALCES
ncbi:MAG: hypothetical protein WBQ20_06675 [Methyloceanibacter sp.]